MRLVRLIMETPPHPPHQISDWILWNARLCCDVCEVFLFVLFPKGEGYEILSFASVFFTGLKFFFFVFLLLSFSFIFSLFFWCRFTLHDL